MADIFTVAFCAALFLVVVVQIARCAWTASKTHSEFQQTVNHPFFTGRRDG